MRHGIFEGYMTSVPLELRYAFEFGSGCQYPTYGPKNLRRPKTAQVKPLRDLCKQETLPTGSHDSKHGSPVLTLLRSSDCQYVRGAVRVLERGTFLTSETK